MKLTQKIHLPECVTAGVAFIYYWIISLYKLTEVSIWQDEAMEYYCSIPVKGAIKGVTDYATMYERMANIQQQPPLYNWVMCLWLQISEHEWWYRFSSVVFGFIAAIGLYILIKKLCNRYIAAFSVVIYSSIYIVQYYIKEAAEYSLLLIFMIFSIYMFFLTMEKATTKRIMVFTLISVAGVYTHYSAAFPVIAMSVTLLIYFMKSKQWKEVKAAVISYAIAVFGAGVPLILLFILPQSQNPVSTIGTTYPIELTKNNIILDFFDSMMWVLRWCMLDYDRDWDKLTWSIWIILFGVILLGIYVFAKTKKQHIKYYIICNVICFIIYYIPTMLTFYAYGWFGNRYNFFIIPMLLVLFILLVYETFNILSEQTSGIIKKLVPYMKVVVVAGMLLYCAYGDYRVHNHWGKMDFRTTISTWYDMEGYNMPTFLDFHQRYGFSYYMTHDERYEESQWDNIYSNMTLETFNAHTEDYIKLLNEAYQNNIPKEMIVITGQWNSLMEALEELGYTIEPILDINVKLYHVVKN